MFTAASGAMKRRQTVLRRHTYTPRYDVKMFRPVRMRLARCHAQYSRGAFIIIIRVILLIAQMLSIEDGDNQQQQLHATNDDESVSLVTSRVTLTLVRASMFAWLSMSSETIAVRPHLLATCRGAMSFCSTTSVDRQYVACVSAPLTPLILSNIL